ncbi:MazG family protein [Janibacter sp. G1551]|uniref:MazG family protein n=1 Tax=Janibacter sp. G1551 TaxID=3420440 RepID=UPI003D00BF27
MPGSLVLLAASPRTAPGLLTRDAWRALEAAPVRWAREEDEPLAQAVQEAGLAVRFVPAEVRHSPASTARLLVGGTPDGDVLWIGSADGDPDLSDAVASEVSSLEDPPEVEVLVGSWDVPGARLLDAVAVMDRLRSPGGCPWDAEQTHESLVKYLLEEAHEAAEAIESGDRAHMAEELGDVLLQVLFQSRVAQDDAQAPFGIDDVAGALVAKLVRRHPHVFADGDASDPAEVEREWERIKAQEKAAKAARSGAVPSGPALLEGIPRSLPTLLVAEKVLARLERTGGDLVAVAEGTSSPREGAERGIEQDADRGAELLAVIARIRQQGGSADVLLRAAVNDLAHRAEG